MKQKELSKTFMMILKNDDLKNAKVVYAKVFQRFKG